MCASWIVFPCSRVSNSARRSWFGAECLGEAVENPRAQLAVARPGRSRRRHGGADRCVHIGGSRGRELGDELAGRGIGALEDVPAGMDKVVSCGG